LSLSPPEAVQTADLAVELRLGAAPGDFLVVVLVGFPQPVRHFAALAVLEIAITSPLQGRATPREAKKMA
jgi:hypothetical protein